MSPNKKILVTGGAGYIGSQTIVELLRAGYEVVSIDNFSNSKTETFRNIKKITGKKVKNYKLDLQDKKKLFKVLHKEKNIDAVVHFAAYKSVPESMISPLSYYENNLVSLCNILEFCREKHILNFVFSSSCAVYGADVKSPVTEKSAFGKALSPYAATKQIGEHLLNDYAQTNSKYKIIALRYFNPIGAHPSGTLGELSKKESGGVVQNMFDSLKKTKPFHIFGDKYQTCDGSAIRDYVHVSDIARAHVLALKKLSQSVTSFDVINLGTGNGVTVFELVEAFEKATGKKLSIVIDKPRSGDIPALFASNSKAKRVLGWKLNYSLGDALKHVFLWETNKKLSK